MPMDVYLNGKRMPMSEATLTLEDRSTLFADGVYEVLRIYNNQLFETDAHLDRLARSAKALLLDSPTKGELLACAKDLMLGQDYEDAMVYIQISRGDQGPRAHQIPLHTTPTWWLWIRAVNPPSNEIKEKGVFTITTPDDRWAQAWIKSVSLLPNILAKEIAHRQGAYDAILVRDGFVTEGTSSNVMIVQDGVLKTPPLTNYILPGITRSVVLRLAANAGIPVVEESISLWDLYRADEAFYTGTTIEILPIAKVDQYDKKVGPVTKTLMNLFVANRPKITSKH